MDNIDKELTADVNTDKPNVKRKKALTDIGFRYAFNGLCTVVITEKNIKIHFCAAFIALILSIVLRISMAELAIITITIGVVISAELFNSAIERLVDYISPDYNKTVGLIKDISAGAVLCCAISALFVGVLIYGKYIVSLLLNLL